MFVLQTFFKRICINVSYTSIKGILITNKFYLYLLQNEKYFFTYFNFTLFLTY